jgi:hypothetical protein
VINSGPDEDPSSIHAKREGVPRVGVVRVNNKSGRSFPLDSLQDALPIHLAKSSLDSVALAGSSSEEINAEARTKQCDYILYTDIICVVAPCSVDTERPTDPVRRVKPRDNTLHVVVDFRLFISGRASPMLNSNASYDGEGDIEVAISMALEKEAATVATATQKRR